MIRVLELQHFGQFHQKRIEVEPGLNIFQGENEKGKSTIQAFILAMFYGFSRDSTKMRLYSEDYDRYRPLQGGNFQGAIEFKCEGENYRLERNFIKSNESCRLINQSTSVQWDSDPQWYQFSRIPQPGVAIFKMDQDHFKNFLLLDDLSNLDLVEIEDQIREELTNLKETGDAAVSLGSAENYLNEQKSLVGTERAKTTPLGKTVGEIEKINSKLHQLRNVNREYQNLLEVDWHYLSKINELTSLLKPLEQELNSDNSQENTDFLHQLRGIRHELMEVKTRKMQVLHDLEILESEYPYLLEDKKRDAKIPLFIGLLIFLSGFVYRFMNYKFAIIALILGLWMIYLYRRQNEGAKKRYRGKLTALDQLQYEERELINQSNLCSQNMESDECIQFIEEYLMGEQRGNRGVFNRIDSIKVQIHELELSRSKNRYELDHLEALRDQQEELKIRLEKRTNQRDDYLCRLEAIERTMGILNLLSREQLGDGYQKFEEHLNSIFSKLTQGRYDRVYLGDVEEIYIQSREHMISLAQLSRGTKDQLFLAIRLALLKLSPSAEVPLVIDDSFVHFDHSRLRTILTYLAQMPRQILLFTAHARELEIVNGEKLSAHIVKW